MAPNVTTMAPNDLIVNCNTKIKELEDIIKKLISSIDTKILLFNLLKWIIELINSEMLDMYIEKEYGRLENIEQFNLFKNLSTKEKIAQFVKYLLYPGEGNLLYNSYSASVKQIIPDINAWNAYHEKKIEGSIELLNKINKLIKSGDTNIFNIDGDDDTLINLLIFLPSVLFSKSNSDMLDITKCGTPENPTIDLNENITDIGYSDIGYSDGSNMSFLFNMSGEDDIGIIKPPYHSDYFNNNNQCNVGNMKEIATDLFNNNTILENMEGEFTKFISSIKDPITCFCYNNYELIKTFIKNVFIFIKMVLIFLNSNILNNLVNDNIDLSWVPKFNEAPTKEDEDEDEDDDEDDMISNLDDMFRGDHEDFFKKIFKLEDRVQEGDNNTNNKIKISDEDRTKFFAIILKNILDESDINKETFNTEFNKGNYDGAIEASGFNILENKMNIVKLLDISNLIPLSNNREEATIFTKDNICKHMNCA